MSCVKIYSVETEITIKETIICEIVVSDDKYTSFSVEEEQVLIGQEVYKELQKRDNGEQELGVSNNVSIAVSTPIFIHDPVPRVFPTMFIRADNSAKNPT